MDQLQRIKISVSHIQLITNDENFCFIMIDVKLVLLVGHGIKKKRNIIKSKWQSGLLLTKNFLEYLCETNQ